MDHTDKIRHSSRVTGALRVLPCVDLPTDEPYWITRETFYSFFEQSDFCCRDVPEVEAAYREDWFCLVEGGRRAFRLPVVGIIEGKTQFISGRHRVAVLLPRMERIPLSFAKARLQPAAIQALLAIPKDELNLQEEIELPDLPIRCTLPKPGDGLAKAASSSATFRPSDHKLFV